MMGLAVVMAVATVERRQVLTTAPIRCGGRWRRECVALPRVQVVVVVQPFVKLDATLTFSSMTSSAVVLGMPIAVRIALAFSRNVGIAFMLRHMYASNERAL